MEPWLDPLFDAAGIRAVDRWAIEEQGVPSPRLMEAAATALADAVAGLAPKGPIRVLCGKGNNGGDGEIAARLLAGMGFEAEVLRIFDADLPDLDAWLAGSGAVVDAIFGTGFEGAPREPAAAAIEAVNRCGAPVVACDIASGVAAATGEVEGAAVEADLTVSFHAPKLGQRIAPGKWHTGELRV
ncbi:MAG: NAD(P)H-hydrate epimerase, partial [Syntrophothermus sp.]